MDEADKGTLITMIDVNGRMLLLVPAHPGCPEQNPESLKTAVCGTLHFILHTFLHLIIVFF